LRLGENDGALNYGLNMASQAFRGNAGHSMVRHGLSDIGFQRSSIAHDAVLAGVPDGGAGAKRFLDKRSGDARELFNGSADKGNTKIYIAQYAIQRVGMSMIRRFGEKAFCSLCPEFRYRYAKRFLRRKVMEKRAFSDACLIAELFNRSSGETLFSDKFHGGFQ